MKRATFLRGAAAFAVAAPAIVRAQGAWPDKQIRMVIPFAAGGTTDLLARALGQHMTQAWGQPAKSAGDGYTLLMVAMGQPSIRCSTKSCPMTARRILRRSAW